MAVAPAAGPRTPYRTHTDGAGVAMVIGAGLAGLVALALLAIALMGFVFATQRDSAGYISTDTTSYSTGTYAFVSDNYRAGAAGDVFVPADVLGKIRIRSTSTQPVFVGIGRAAAVDAYLSDVAREQVDAFEGHHTAGLVIRGHGPDGAPAAQRFWAASNTGTGTQQVTWVPRRGDWKIVVMNADASRGVDTDLSVGARFPHLVAIAVGILGGGALFTGLAALGFTKGLRRLR